MTRLVVREITGYRPLYGSHPFGIRLSIGHFLDMEVSDRVRNDVWEQTAFLIKSAVL